MDLRIHETRESEGKGVFIVSAENVVVQRAHYDESVTDPFSRRTRREARAEILSFFNGFKDGIYWAAGKLHVRAITPNDIWQD